MRAKAKYGLALALVGVLAYPAAVKASYIYSDSFETDTVGSSSVSGWSVGTSANATLTVSNAKANTGTQSIYMVDNSTSGNPSMIKDFGSNNASGNISWAYLADSASTNWRIDLYASGAGGKTFDLNSAGSTINLRNSSGTTVSSGTLSDSPSYSATAWNVYHLVYDSGTSSIQVYLNNDSTPIINTNALNPGGIGKIGVNQGYGGGSGYSGYFDDISAVPEPASAALLLLGGPLLATRQRRRGAGSI